jgi:biopolymer transport protein ExbB
VKLKNEENAYLASILDEFTRGFETRLFPGEAPRYKPILEEAKLVMTNNDMGAADKFARQVAAVKAALARVEDIVGGARFPGEAVDTRGNLHRGTFAMLGPTVLFAPEFGEEKGGIAVAQTSSPKPLIRAIPTAEELAQPHEKVMLWFQKKFGKKDAHAQVPGVLAVVKEGAGWFPLDPSKGAAIQELIKETNLIEMFIHGGPIMWPLLLASIAAFTVVFERVIFVLNENRKRSRRKMEEFFGKCEAHDIEGAISVSKTTKDFIVRTLGYALEHRETSLNSALVFASTTAMKRFNRGLMVLDTVITLAPMLGLLGTVTGMMGSFQSLGGENSNPTAIMGGISEALIATAAGLIVALVCLLPYNYLNAKIEAAQKELETATARLELLITPPSYENLTPPTPPSHGSRSLAAKKVPAKPKLDALPPLEPEGGATEAAS